MHYVYHPNHEPRVVETSEYNRLLAQGWYDSPAKFPENREEEVVTAPKKKGRPPKVKPEEIGVNAE